MIEKNQFDLERDINSWFLDTGMKFTFVSNSDGSDDVLSTHCIFFPSFSASLALKVCNKQALFLHLLTLVPVLATGIAKPLRG